MRERYEQELEILNNKLIEMGALVEDNIQNALTALRERDDNASREVILRDREVDIMEQQIESLAMSLLLRQQPVAGDLRLIASVLKIITDLERIGDHAQDISEISLSMPDDPLTTELDYINKMYEACSFMIKSAIDSFIAEDVELAQQCIEHDDVVDGLYEQVRTKLIAFIREDESRAEELIDLLQIAKYLERVGDHTENIAEWVIYSVTGEHVDGVLKWDNYDLLR